METQNDRKNIDAFLIVERGVSEETVKFFPLVKRSTLIGRSTQESSPDIRINDPNISRRHVEVRFEDDCFWLCDLGSTNGTVLNGQLVEEGRLYPLIDNSVIGLAILKGSPRAVLRFRQLKTTEPESAEEIAQFSSWLKIDDERKEIWVDGRLLALAKKEYDLLLLLYRKAGRVCSRDEIVSEVWPEAIDPGAVSDATIDQLIHRLRQKIEPSPSKPVRIVRKKAFGYMLV